jgi:thiol:disulfide interchange protein DsbC
MNRLIRSAALPLLLLGALAPTAHADEAALRALVEQKFPGQKVREVRRLPFGALYEVVVGERIFYTDEKMSHLFVGAIIESATSRNLTDLRLRQLTAIDVKQFPLDAAIRTVRGDGKRVLYVFSDPLCPFCAQLEAELAKITNVTIYTFLTPVEQMRPGSRLRALEVWCSTDRVRAWDDWMLRQVAPKSKPTCRNPIDQLVKLSDKLGFQVTPVLVFGDGAVLNGMIPAAQIERHMNAILPPGTAPQPPAAPPPATPGAPAAPARK